MGTVVETPPSMASMHATHSPQDSTGTFGVVGGPAQHGGKGLLALASPSTSSTIAAHPASVHFALDEAARRDHTHMPSKAKGNGAQGPKGASTEANSISASSSKPTPRPPKPKTQSLMSTTSTGSSVFAGAADSAWGANFWVTLVEPQVSCCFAFAHTAVLTVRSRSRLIFASFFFVGDNFRPGHHSTLALLPVK